MVLRNRIIKRLLLIIAVALAAASFAMAQTPTHIKIGKGLDITLAGTLDFGEMYYNSAVAGSCTLPTNGGNRVFTGGANATPITTKNIPVYNVKGTKNLVYTVNINYSEPFDLILSGFPAEKLRVDTWHILYNGETDVLWDFATTTGTLDNAGKDSFTLGATLRVPAGAKAGVYNGTFTVTVFYE